jgi:hypothetical protein
MCIEIKPGETPMDKRKRPGAAFHAGADHRRGHRLRRAILRIARALDRILFAYRMRHEPEALPPRLQRDIGLVRNRPAEDARHSLNSSSAFFPAIRRA